MHKVTLFPLGNADCSRIDLANGRKLLFDYAAMRDPADESDRRIDLAKELRDDLETSGRDYHDVVAFSHLDDDHIHGASEFFWFEHAKKYQGEGRIEIREMWVPAAVIIEEGCEEERAIIQAEARHRLRRGKGIRVFSRPVMLEEWLEQQGLTLADRRHLITDAGQLVPGFSLASDEIEFFVHSPFATRLEDGTLVDRNTDALVLQATFLRADTETRLLLTSDIDHEVLAHIVKVTRSKGNDVRLEWDAVKIPHHCSYTALGPEKGKEKTQPVPEVGWIYEDQGRPGGILVSSSRPIPSDDDDDQPPHRQAASYYRERASALNGEFKVTMEHPKTSAPEPVVIKIDSRGAAIEKKIAGGVAAIVSHSAPRAG